MSHWEPLDRLYEEAAEYATNWESYIRIRDGFLQAVDPESGEPVGSAIECRYTLEWTGPVQYVHPIP